MPAHDAQRYEYRLPTMRAVLMVLVAFAVPASVAYIAYTNIKAVRIAGLISLSPDQASLFFWGLAALCLVAAFVALWVAVRSQAGPGYVELGVTGALLPRASLSAPLISIPYSTITQVRVVNVSGQQMVAVNSAAGQARVMSKAFAKQSAFASFVTTLQERVRVG
jgi:hypothetical protein